MDRFTVYGIPLGALSDHELARSIERAIEKARDAYGYGGPAHARMYEDELMGLLMERARREREHFLRAEPPIW